MVASAGQRELCRGQGAELVWARDPKPLKSKQVLEIFRQKTAPAFEVALKLGASYAGRLDEVSEVLEKFSENMGIAYQIQDDMDDLGEDAGDNELDKMRPSVLLAVARERARGDDKTLMESLWSHKDLEDVSIHKIRRLAQEVEADNKCLLLLETYKETAVRSLAELEDANLKGLLRRVMGKIFNDLEIKGWCREQEVKNGVREVGEGAE